MNRSTNIYTPFRRLLHQAEVELDLLLMKIPQGSPEYNKICEFMLDVNNILNKCQYVV